MMFGVAYLIVLVPVCWLIVVITARVPKGAAIPLEQLGIEKPGAMSRAREDGARALRRHGAALDLPRRHRPRRDDDPRLGEPLSERRR